MLLTTKAEMVAISNVSQPVIHSSNMNTSSFLTALRANESLPLVFRTSRQLVSPGYHLTEVKRVSYETMDCGAMLHRWAESQFEIWVPALAGAASDRGHMPAGKFLKIVDRVEAELPLKGEAIARVHASFDGQPAALYDIDAVTPRDGKLWIELSPDRTRCKAAERRGAAATGGCCGSKADESEGQEVVSDCGCGASKAEAAIACCA
jgi:hypothetical protein